MTTPRLDPMRVRTPRGRRRAFWAAVVLGVAGIGAAFATMGERVVSPGPLSNAHAMLAEDCGRCHTIPYRDVRAILGADAQRAMNAACLDCHGERLSHDEIMLDPHHGAGGERLEGAACADCHVEHDGVEDLRAVADLACAQCHGQLEQPITHFASTGAAGDHPDFRPPLGSDPGTLHFDHSVHLQGGRTTCSDCHRATDPRAEHRRGPYMDPVRYERDCGRCHPLTLQVGDVMLDLPHEAPVVVDEYLAIEAEERGLGASWPATAALHLYADKGVCGLCHTLGTLPDEPRITPVAIPERWYEGARFDHGQHTAVGYLTEDFGRDAACRHCHVSALSSTHASDVAVPGIETCQQCHGQGTTDACTTCHSFHEPRLTTGVRWNANPEVIARGREETRLGMRRSSPFWTKETFLSLPQTVWGTPQIEPGSAEFDREVFERYGLFRVPGLDNGDLPMGMVETSRPFEDQPGIGVTCELCHSSLLFGQLVEGQPNRFSSMEDLFRDLNRATGSPLRHPLYDKNPEANSMVNGADHLGLLGLVIRQPDLGLDLPTLYGVMNHEAMELKPEFDALAYIKTPPWYTYRTKLDGVAGYYFDGGHPKDGNFSAFTYVCSFYDIDGADIREALTAWAEGGHAYLASLEAPAYPFTIDKELAARGRTIYEQSCASCHGHYQGEQATPQTLVYPGLITPVEDVGTDPLRANFPNSFKVRMRKILRGEYVLNRGYVAAPLTAIWARAPYLHNASVPTMRTLLQPFARPARWVLVADPNEKADYLQDDMGWRFEPLAEGEVTESRRVYDPAVTPGLGNEGHTYGSDLMRGEKDALIEFLKTL